MENERRDGRTNGRRHDDVSLREYIERILAGHDEKHRAEQQELNRAQDELERRLAELNQLRDEVLTDRQRFITREVHEAKHKELQTQIDDLKRSRAVLVGVGLVMVPLSGLVGAAIMRAFT